MAACEALCALLRVRTGPCPHRGFSGRIWAVFEGRKKEQEKALTPFCVRAATTTRSAGGFRELGPTLFQRAECGFDADLEGLAPKAQNYKVLNDAIMEKEVVLPWKSGKTGIPFG